jgi:hypothetical protein
MSNQIPSNSQGYNLFHTFRFALGACMWSRAAIHRSLLENCIRLFSESGGTRGMEGAVHLTFKIPLRSWKSARTSGRYFKANQCLDKFQNSPARFLEKQEEITGQILGEKPCWLPLSKRHSAEGEPQTSIHWSKLCCPLSTLVKAKKRNNHRKACFTIDKRWDRCTSDYFSVALQVQNPGASCPSEVYSFHIWQFF